MNASLSAECLTVAQTQTYSHTHSPYSHHSHHYTLQVFEEYASQEEVYEHALQEIPEKLINGFNCTVIAYGQTGTGKTHTMMGVNGGSDGLIQLWKRESSLRAQEMMDSSRSLQGGPTSSVAPSIAESAISKDDTVAAKDNEEVNPEAEGMIPKVVAHVFKQMALASSSTEFIVRCSYVEIYLEKILDLLHPKGGNSIALSIEKEADKAAGVGNHVSNVKIVGASELCCFDVGDVCALLTRGNAWRTRSATEMNTDSSRSHAIFTMRIEQLDRITSQTITSTLQMLDLAGSELAANPGGSARSNAVSSTALQVEAKMINKSLNALQKMIRIQLENQRGAMISFDAAVRQSKLTRLLRPSFGGNCLTTMILTASPSSYNIGETISTIRFGQRCRKVINQPTVTVEDSAKVCRQKLFESEKKNEETMALVRTLANKCQTLHVGTGEPATGPLWETIENITSEDDDDPLDFKVTVQKRRSNGESHIFERQISLDTAHSELTEKLNEKIDTLEEELFKTIKSRDDAENTLAELQSEVAVLRTQNENLTADKKRIVTDLMESKNEVQILSQRKLEVEHNLRTSQFRENEAIVFLRQFRRFYTNVLKDKAAHGAGSIKGITTEITHKVQNAPDLNKLRDIDEMLFEAGLLEEHEMGEDRSSAAYKPSKDSLMRSAAAASRAARVEAELKSPGSNSINGDEAALVTGAAIGVIHNFTGVGQLEAISEMDAGVSASDVDLHRSRESLNDSMEELHDAEGNSSLSADADAGAGLSEVLDSVTPAHSISRAAGTGLMVTRQQKVLRTPSGRLTMLREKDLEKELMDMSERCIELQMALNEEKAIVDALTNKAGGISKKKIAQEAISLREQLDKKTASLTAIAWKMNELNLINKTYNEKMVTREQHVFYLEENLFEMQETTRRVTLERQESEKKLRDEIEQLIKIVEGTAMPLWQFGEAQIGSRPLASRILLPFASSQQGDEPNVRRFSLGALESDMDEVFEADARSSGLAHVSKVETMECETQTDDANIESVDAQVGDLYKKTPNVPSSASSIHPSLIQSLPEKSGVGGIGGSTTRESDSFVRYDDDQDSYDNDYDSRSNNESHPDDPEPIHASASRTHSSTTDSVQSMHASEDIDNFHEKKSNKRGFGDDAVRTGDNAISSQNSQDVTTNSEESDGSNCYERSTSSANPRTTVGMQSGDHDEIDFESDSDIEPKPKPRFSESDSYSESESDTNHTPIPAPFQRSVSEGESSGSSKNMAVATGGRDSTTADVVISNKIDNRSLLENMNEIGKENSNDSDAEDANLEPERPHNAAFEVHSDGEESEYDEVENGHLTLQSSLVEGESDDDESESDVESDSRQYHQKHHVTKSGISEIAKGKVQPSRSLLSESESESEVDPLKTKILSAARNHSPKGASSESVDDDDDYFTDDSGPGVGKQWVDGVPPPLHEPVRQLSSASASLNDGLGLNDDFDYDDLGKKWGMSESEIAEDAAILTPRRPNSEDMAPPASTALAAVLNGAESTNSDEDSINWGPGSTPEIVSKVVNDVKPVIKGWRSDKMANSKPPRKDMVTKVEKVYADEDSINAFPDKGTVDDDASYDDNSDDNDTYDESVKKVDQGADSSFSEEDNQINNSLNEDDFDKMMGEAAAALAAAEEFIPSDDDSLEPNSDSYQPMDKKKFSNDDSDASPIARKPVGKPKQGGNVDNRPSDLRRLTEEQLKGGKAIGYTPKRFVEKLGPRVKPAVSKGGNKSLLPEYDDFSVSVAPDSQSVSLSVSHSIRERQLPVAEERKIKIQNKREKESKKSSSSSKPKAEETKKHSSRKDKERSSSRKPSTKEATVRSRSKSKSRHARDEDGEKKKIRGAQSGEELKKKKSTRKLDDDKKKKVKSVRGDEDEKKKSKKKKSDILDVDTKKKKKTKKISEDGERPKSRETRP